MSANTDKWIGVADVAAEMNLTERAAWELVRRLCVPMLEPSRAVMKTARFRRSDWEARRDGALKAPTPRSQAEPATGARPAGRPTKQAKTAGIADKLAKLRGA